MSLIAINGKHQKDINFQLMKEAIKHLPTLLIDCANAADPHKFYSMINLETMQQIYVFEFELLHRFRDVLKQAPKFVRQLEAKSIIVTTSDHLINYRDEEENRDIYIHAWQLLSRKRHFS